ncbi:hypothetical protein DFP74_1819 [Nocardiopsis sp. Huas11]|uniref:hypothetical protein n=1 Tax=Nocardiopsis sp. Huas11 TaxID=2183912 RepID=UPI000F2DBDE2|nr:hypothetical protein [Nocardiopsis sp. Huas11]RKS06195.1 hypothetical protein DFP74_1819 [Nocardiopsis sp. Huas11]
MAAPTEAPPAPHVGEDRATRHENSNANANAVISQRGGSTSASSARSARSGNGDHASEFTSAMGSIYDISAKVLDFVTGIFFGLLNFALSLVNLLAGRPLRRFFRWRLRKGRIPTRARTRARIRQARRATKSMDRALGKVRERAGAYVGAAKIQRALIISQVRERVAGEIRQARHQRDVRVDEARVRAGGLVVQAKVTGRKAVQRAENQKRDLIRKADGKGPEAERRARTQGEAIVRRAKLESGQREQRATRRADQIITNVRRAENANVQATIRRGTADLRDVVRQTDRLVRTAEDRAGRAVAAAESAHSAYKDQVNERVKDLQALRKDKKTPKAVAKEVLRTDSRTAAAQRKQFKAGMAATNPASLPNVQVNATQNAHLGRAGGPTGPRNGPNRPTLHAPGLPRQQGRTTAQGQGANSNVGRLRRPAPQRQQRAGRRHGTARP